MRESALANSLWFNFSAPNVKVTRGALGLVGESPGVTVFCFIMRR